MILTPLAVSIFLTLFLNLSTVVLGTSWLADVTRVTDFLGYFDTSSPAISVPVAPPPITTKLLLFFA